MYQGLGETYIEVFFWLTVSGFVTAVVVVAILRLLTRIPRNPDRDFPGTHAWARANVFTRSARPQYDITADNRVANVAQLADVILKCSEYFQRRHAFLRDCFEEQRYHGAFLADPELPG